MNKEKGAILLMALIFVFVMIAFAISFMVQARNEINLSTLHTASIKAFYLAEGGIAKAQYYLSEDLNFRTESLAEELGDGDYEMIIKDLEDGLIQINSIGRVTKGEFDKGTREIEVVLKKVAGFWKVISWREL